MKHIIIPRYIAHFYGMGDIINIIQLGLQLAEDSKDDEVTLYLVITPHCRISESKYNIWHKPIIKLLLQKASIVYNYKFVILDFFTNEMIEIQHNHIKFPTFSKEEQEIHDTVFEQFDDKVIKYLADLRNEILRLDYIPPVDIDYNNEYPILRYDAYVNNNNISWFEQTKNPSNVILVEHPAEKQKHLQSFDAHLKSTFESNFIDMPKVKQTVDEKDMLYFPYKKVNDTVDIDAHNEKTIKYLTNSKWIIGPEGGIMHFCRISKIPFVLVIPEWILDKKNRDYYYIWHKQNPWLKNTKITPVGILFEKDLKDNFTEKYEVIDDFIEKNKKFEIITLFSETTTSSHFKFLEIIKENFTDKLHIVN